MRGIRRDDVGVGADPDDQGAWTPILFRADGAGATKAWLQHLHQPRVGLAGLQVDCSVGFNMIDAVQQVILTPPKYAWIPAAQVDGSPPRRRRHR